jgi:hypothetical protein
MNEHFGFVADSKLHRTIPKEETNPHKRMVNYILKVTRAENGMNIINKVIRPLPDTA